MEDGDHTDDVSVEDEMEQFRSKRPQNKDWENNSLSRLDPNAWKNIPF